MLMDANNDRIFIYILIYIRPNEITKVYQIIQILSIFFQSNCDQS